VAESCVPRVFESWDNSAITGSWGSSQVSIGTIMVKAHSVWGQTDSRPEVEEFESVIIHVGIVQNEMLG
jgi:hypothetical protein